MIVCPRQIRISYGEIIYEGNICEDFEQYVVKLSELIETLKENDNFHKKAKHNAWGRLLMKGIVKVYVPPKGL